MLSKLSLQRGFFQANFCRIEEMDALVQKYFSSPESERLALRNEIFFRFFPFISNSLRKYCRKANGQNGHCLGADWLSDSFIAFAELLNKYDRRRKVNFVGYIVKGMSWRLFNRLSREQRYYHHHVFFADSPAGVRLENRLLWEGHRRVAMNMDMRKCLSFLEKSVRELVLGHYWWGYSYEELAALQNKKACTLRKTVQLAKEKIRRAYSQGSD
ncbi:MAG: sigma-70 family RNA polymerase sigma factor [Calditrichaeota bacterium]|nr:MAG: sigma-70 family RNA polymerase sigma factor [Calditrichota bacterium]